MIHFSEKSWNLNSVNLFLKCGNYNKSRFYEQILKVGISTFRKFFSFSYAELTLKIRETMVNRMKLNVSIHSPRIRSSRYA